LPQLLPGLYALLTTVAGSVQDEALKAQYNISVVMAATVLVMLPLIIAYFVMQKKFVESIERSGVVG
jgi:multiple sugar transport system permease protein